MQPREKALAVSSLLANVVYIIWLICVIRSPAAWVLVATELGFLSLVTLKVFNHWTTCECERSQASAPGTLDIFLPIVNEPIALFRSTLASVTTICAPGQSIYVLDDGPREEIKALAAEYGALYVAREGPRVSKAHNLNHGMSRSKGDFILVLDADQVVHDSRVVLDLLGHFRDSTVALVATRQVFHNIPAHDFNHDTFFYQRAQPGKNADNAAISCGTGVVYRRSALQKIGGFQEWNIVEDLTTSYALHCAGFRSLYTQRAFASGIAPLDLPSIYKQRLDWATDTLRLFLRRNPMLQRSLTIRQRIHYWEIGWSYVISALCIPISYAILDYSLFTNAYLLPASKWYLVLKFGSLCLPLALAWLLSAHSLSGSRAWAALWPVNLLGLGQALLPWKTSYRVTDKVTKKRYWHAVYLWPQALLLVVTLFGLALNLRRYGLTSLAMAGAFWTAVACYWLFPLFERVVGATANSSSWNVLGAGRRLIDNLPTAASEVSDDVEEMPVATD